MNAPRNHIPIDVLVGRLNDDLLRLIDALDLGGRREGREWRAGRKADGFPGDSLSVVLEGAKRGVFFWGALGKGGDALELVAQVKFAGDKSAAVRWVRDVFLGMVAEDPAQLERERDARRARQRAADRQEQEKIEARVRRAAGIWHGAQAEIRDTLVDRYLLGRGIDLRLLGRAPGSIRYCPALDYWHEGAKVGAFPAMVTAVAPARGAMRAVHQTWLQVYDDGFVGKLRGTGSAKKIYGDYRGGFARIWRGTVADPATGEIRPAPPIARAAGGSSVIVTEGIEDALTLALALPDRRIVAGLTVGNLAVLDLPETIGEVILAADNDDADSKAAEALLKAIDAHAAAGRAVSVYRAGGGHKDPNALLLSAAEAG